MAEFWNLSYINPLGQQIDFQTLPLAIASIEGLETPATLPHIQKAPYQDGYSYLSSELDAREITVNLGIIGGYDDAVLYATRRQLSNLLNPALHKDGDLGTLIYTDKNVERQIDCRVEEVRIPQQQRARPGQPFTVVFSCPSPYLLDSFEGTATIETLTNLLEFPAGGNEWITAGIEYGNYLVGQPIELVNEGDVDAPITLVFFGPGVNPKITNSTTGEYIEFTITLDAGDTLTIDTDAKTVVFYDASGPSTLNGNQYLNLASTFWSLVTGTNSIQFTTSDSSTSARCQIVYRERFVSI